MLKFNFLGDIHFVTARTFKNIQFFKDIKCCELFLENLAFYRNKYDLKIYGYCIMPNHVHLLISFDMEKYPELTISKVMQRVNGYSSKLIGEYLIKNNNNITCPGRQGSHALPGKSRGAGLH